MPTSVNLRRAVFVAAVAATLTACGSSCTRATAASAPATSPAGPSTTAGGAGTTTSTTTTSTTATSTTTVSSSSAGGPPVPAGAASVPAPTKADVAYADVSPSQVLDLWLPSGATGPTPLVVDIHGGAFRSGDKAMETGNVRALLDRGYAVASLNYRLSGEAPFPAAVQDVKAAVRYLRANASTFNLNPEQFAAWGASAGGNLAAMLGVTGAKASSELDDPSLGNAGVSSAVQAVVDLFGPTDFLRMDSQRSSSRCPNPDAHDPASSPESIYVGAAIQTVPDQADAASPLSYVSAAEQLPVFVLAHGDRDCVVPPAQSQTLYDALVARGAKATLTILPGVGHADPVIQQTQTGPAIAVLDEVFGR